MREQEHQGNPKLEGIAEEVLKELGRAMRKFPPFHSAHEGYAILLEEVDEAWEAIKRNDLDHARLEMLQVAAMALRFVHDLTPSADTDKL